MKSRILSIESLEERRLLAGDCFQNPLAPYDVNADGTIGLTDLRLVFSGLLTDTPEGEPVRHFVDVDGDGRVSVTDLRNVFAKVLSGEQPGDANLDVAAQVAAIAEQSDSLSELIANWESSSAETIEETIGLLLAQPDVSTEGLKAGLEAVFDSRDDTFAELYEQLGEAAANGLERSGDLLDDVRDRWQESQAESHDQTVSVFQRQLDAENNQAPSILPVAEQVVSDQRGPQQLQLVAFDADSDPLQFRLELTDSDDAPATVDLDGDVLTISPIAGRQGSFPLRVIVSDGYAEDSTTFTIHVNQATVGGVEISGDILPRWLDLGGFDGMGAPTAAAESGPDGKQSQEFEGGVIAWSQDEGFRQTNYGRRAFLQASTASTISSHTRRPTLLVLTQGANTGGHYTYNWQLDLAANLRADLESAGSQVHAMIVEWDSFKPNDRGVRHVAAHIDDWLSQREQDWDVVMVGHSRGAVFNHELTQELADHGKIGYLQHIMVDPTASVTHGDQYPNSVPMDVEEAVVYDDGYVFIPLAVKDGLPVNGADYRRVSLSGIGYQDMVGSHKEIANWYADEGYQQDLESLLANKPEFDSAPFQHETLRTGNEVVMAPGPVDGNSIIDIGMDTNENGNFHGWISFFPIGGVDVTIGKDGLDLSAGLAVIGSGAVSMSSQGWTAHVNVFNFIGGGVIIGSDETRVDVDLLGVNVNLFGKGAGIYVGGNKLSLDVNAAMADNTLVLETLQQAGGSLRETFEDGKQIAKDTWDDAGNYVSERWDAANNYLLERGNALGKTYTEARDAAGKLVSKAWNDAGQWTSQQFDAAGDLLKEWVYYDAAGDKLEQFRAWSGGKLTDLEEFTESGWKNVNKYLNSKGQWVSQRLDSAGKLLKEWVYYDAAGDKLEQFRAWSGGKLTDLEEFTESGWKNVNKYLNSKGQWVSQRLDAAGKLLKEWVYYDAAGDKLEQFRAWSGGKLTDLEKYTESGWQNVNKYLSSKGQWVSQRFDSAGKLLKEWVYYDAAGDKLEQFRAWSGGKLTDLEEYTESGWKNVNKYLNSKGQWVSQRFDSAGKLLKEWVYYDAAGDKLEQFRAWSGGKLTDLEKYTESGWQNVNKYLSSKGQWVSQRFDSAGKLLKEWVYYDAAGDKLEQFRAWSGGRLTDLEEFTKSGWQNVNKYLSSSGRWVSQRLDSTGDVIKEWVYYDAAGDKLRQFRAWSGDRLSDLTQYASNGVKTLDAYISTTGNWVERSYHNGVEQAVRVWNSSGKYLGDKLKNYADGAAKLDPTTKDWWPF